MCQDTYARMIIKQGSGVPTIPVSTDHRNGDWIATDIYEGEFYMDTDTGIIYTSNGGVIQKAGLMSDNFANADLTFDANRTHDLAEFTVGILNGDVVFTNAAAGSATAVSITNNNTANVALELVSGHLKITGIATYADEAAAVTGGLATNVVYKTATGELRIKL